MVLSPCVADNFSYQSLQVLIKVTLVQLFKYTNQVRFYGH